jgi:hypothetical protein
MFAPDVLNVPRSDKALQRLASQSISLNVALGRVSAPGLQKWHLDKRAVVEKRLPLQLYIGESHLRKLGIT